MAKKRKNIYQNYSTQDLEKAVSAVRAGMSVRKASMEYSVPKTTIHDHVSGKIEPGAKPGKPPAIPNEIEAKVVKSALEAADMGFGISRGMLKAKTGQLVNRLKLPTPFKNGVPGNMWWRGLKSRHPELVIRKPEKLSTVRSRMMNREVVSKYFSALDQLVTDLQLHDKPECIWNCDEKGFQFEHSPVSVCARKGSRSLPGRISNSRESISVLATINALGVRMPPMVVVKGKTRRSLESFSTADGPPNTVWTFQKKAWMTDALGEQWFEEVFLKYCGPHRPQLLILDSHRSHEVLGLLQMAKANGIHILALPPHTTAWLQPLDRTVFGPLSRSYNKVCSEFLGNNPCNLINKATWPALFSSAWESSVTPNNIKAGFKACGIYPVDLGAIPDQAFHTSIPFDIPLSQSQSAALSACASTSTGICSSAISSPTSSSVAPAICTTSSSSSLSLSEIPSTSVLSRAQPTSASSASITPSDILNSSVPPSDLANSTDSPPGTLLAEVTLEAADPHLTDAEFAIATTDDLLHLASVLDLDLPISSEINDIFSPKPNKSSSVQKLAYMSDSQCENSPLPDSQREKQRKARGGNVDPDRKYYNCTIATISVQKKFV